MGFPEVPWNRWKAVYETFPKDEDVKNMKRNDLKNLKNLKVQTKSSFYQNLPKNQMWGAKLQDFMPLSHIYSYFLNILKMHFQESPVFAWLFLRNKHVLFLQTESTELLRSESSCWSLLSRPLWSCCLGPLQKLLVPCLKDGGRWGTCTYDSPFRTDTSSPLSFSSLTMSRPPISSPFTYSCGYVGQLE